jgi:predicted RNA-binding Zn-ribbon protein involved in translation (DUF1610 family)
MDYAGPHCALDEWVTPGVANGPRSSAAKLAVKTRAKVRIFRLAPLPGALECPQCGSRDVVRCHRSTVERLALNPLFLRAFVCRDCQRRYYGFAWRDRSLEVSRL